MRRPAGYLRKQHGRWIGAWYSGGNRKSKTLGLIREVSRGQAQDRLTDLIRQSRDAIDITKFGPFVDGPYFKFFGRKWKASTYAKNVNRITLHLVSEFATRNIASFRRDELQDFLDEKAKTLSHSMVNHLRWDLKQVFDLAIAEGHTRINPALMLFTPRHAKTGVKMILTIEQFRLALTVLEERERLIVKLAFLVGMRPGEIFALTWGRIGANCAEIAQRVYDGALDTPKSARGYRKAAIPKALMLQLAEWRRTAIDCSPATYIFPSEKMTPLSKNNVWRRNMQPRLKTVGLEWATFQVMRRTFTTLCKANGGDAKAIADQCGHDIGVSLREYVQTPLDGKLALVNDLERLVLA